MDTYSNISELPSFDTLNVMKKNYSKPAKGTNDAYKYVEEQIEQVEKLVIEQCHFCRDHVDDTYDIENIGKNIENNNKRTTTDDNKRMVFVQTLEDYLNHFEFIIMEEILIGRNNDGDSPYNHYTEEQWNKLRERVIYLRKITDKLSKSLKFKMEQNTHINIDTITQITFVFLPLAFITSYFGMNFTRMGMVGYNMNKKGILMWKHGHWFVICLLIVSALLASIILYLIKNNHKFNQSI